MANPKHLEILRQGVEEWNQWRQDRPSKKPDFAGEDFSKVNLYGIDFSGADLCGVNFKWADLRWANLKWARLNKAKLYRADLSGAYLIGADLRRADFSNTTCNNAIFKMADLRTARLIDAVLDGATLTGACLWEAQRAGWSVRGVICEHTYWDEEGEEKSVYSPGEFERLFAHKTKIRLFYRDGINPLEIATIPALIKHLENSHPGSGLRLVSIREDSGGAVVELAIEDDSDKSPEQLRQLKAEIETAAQRAIEYERKFLAEEKQRLRLEGEVNQLSLFVDKLILRPSINVQGDYMGDTYNVSGQAGAVGQNAHAQDMTFNQVVNHFEKSIDLSELAKQLGELREEMAKDSSPQSAIAQGETAKAEIAAQSGNTSKVMEHLKSAGKWTLDFAKEVGKDLAVEAIKQSMGMP